MKRVVVLALLAACPKHAEHEPVAPQPRHDAAALAADPAGSAGSAVVMLPPAPPVPEVPAGLPLPPPHDGITPDAIALGALLFVDPALSATGKTACASCHDPAHGFAGAKVPPLVNLAWVRDRDWPAFLARHAADTLHGSAPHSALYDAYKLDPTLALIAYVLTRYEGDSAWDRAERSAHPPAAAAAGYRLFAGKARCAHCHAPPLYTDLAVHGGVRTPTLRGVAKRTAYLHDGSAASLDAAVAHPGQEVTLSPVEKSALVAFLQAL